jgi:hypothetical protein
MASLCILLVCWNAAQNSSSMTSWTNRASWTSWVMGMCPSPKLMALLPFPWKLTAVAADPGDNNDSFEIDRQQDKLRLTRLSVVCADVSASYG